jgi:hypothetical protein
MHKHLPFDECIKLAGEEPAEVEPILNWVCSINGQLTSFDSKAAAEAHGGIINEVVMNELELEKYKELYKQYAGKIHEIWFENLYKEFEQYGLNDSFWDIYQYIESEHEYHLDQIDPDEIYISMLKMVEIVLAPFTENVLRQVSTTRNAFYFKTSNGYTKL